MSVLCFSKQSNLLVDYFSKISMKNVENLETSLSITLELEVVNIQRCSIIVPHKEGDEGGRGGEPAWQIWFIPATLRD